MRKYFNTFGLILISTFCFSQSAYKKHQVFYLPSEPDFISIPSKSAFTSYPDLLSFLETNYLNTQFSGQKLELASIKESPIGKHYRYKHIFKNMPVYQSFIQANYDKKGNLILVINNLAKFDDYDIPEFYPNKGTFWVNTNNGLTPAYVQERWDSSKNRAAQYYYNNEDKLILTFDSRLYFHGPDSMVSAMVYLPNPIVAANTTYGGGFVDNNDQNTTELTNARSKVRVPLKFENGKFKLSNGLITLKNLHDPIGNPITPTDTFLNYTRDQSGFEDINVYYHLNDFSTYLKKSGFGNLLDTIFVDAHGANEDDNSFLDTKRDPLELEYGTGNVDDGEDGQVVIHEFGHSLSVIASPGTVNGAERASMEEGQADYLAMSYSRSLSKNKPNEVFSWDGHNTFWAGFSTNSTLKYQKRTNVTDVDRQIWSTALMCMHDKLRATQSDSLVLSSYFLQASQTTMPQMARVILKIDSLLYNGKEVGKIWQCFTNQGILDTVPAGLSIINPLSLEDEIKFLNTFDFSRGLSNAIIYFSNTNLWKDIDIYNNLGQKIKTLIVKEENTLSPESLNSGIYYLKINSKDGRVSFTKKIIKF